MTSIFDADSGELIYASPEDDPHKAVTAALRKGVVLPILIKTITLGEPARWFDVKEVGSQIVMREHATA